MKPGFMFTEADLEQYARTHDAKETFDWLLLITPDRFDGNYGKAFGDLFIKVVDQIRREKKS